MILQFLTSTVVVQFIKRTYVLSIFLMAMVVLRCSVVLAVEDPIYQYYLQQKLLYHSDGPKMSREQQKEILDGISNEIKGSPNNSIYANIKLWLGQEYNSLGFLEPAKKQLSVVAANSEILELTRQKAKIDLAQVYVNSGDAKRAENIWFDIARDQSPSNPFRARAADKIRETRMLREDWPEVRKIVEYQLEAGLGRTSILYETLARSARRTGDFKTAETYYAKLVNEFPNYRRTGRMMYIEKGGITSRYEGRRHDIRYLTDMTQVVERYQKKAQDLGTHYSEVYQEYYTLALQYLESKNAYQQESREMPISKEEAWRRSLDLLQRSMDGLSEMPKELRSSIQFEAVASGAYITAAQLHSENGDISLARKAIEEFLNLYPEINPEYLLRAQKLLNSITWGVFDPSIFEPRSPDEIVREALEQNEATNAKIVPDKVSMLQRVDTTGKSSRGQELPTVSMPSSGLATSSNPEQTKILILVLIGGIIASAFLGVVVWKKRRNQNARSN